MCTQFSRFLPAPPRPGGNAVSTWVCVRSPGRKMEVRHKMFRTILWLQRGGLQGSGRKEIIKAKRNSFAPQLQRMSFPLHYASLLQKPGLNILKAWLLLIWQSPLLKAKYTLEGRGITPQLEGQLASDVALRLITSGFIDYIQLMDSKHWLRALLFQFN